MIGNIPPAPPPFPLFSSVSQLTPLIRIPLPEISHPPPQHLRSLPHHLVHDLRRGLDPRDGAGDLAHQVRELDVLDAVLEVVLDGHDAPVAEGADLLGVGVPPRDVRVRAHAQRPARQHQRALRVVEAARDHGALVRLAARRLRARHEPRPDPDPGRALHQRRRDGAPARDAARRDHERRLRPPAEHRGPVPRRHVRDGGDQHRPRHVAGVAAPLPALRAHHVDARVERLDGVLRVPHHVHDEDAGPVQLVDDPGGRHAHRADEQPRPARDRDVDQLAELAPRVVVVGLARRPAHLRERQVDPEGPVLRVPEERLHLRDDLPELVRRVLEPADHAEPARVRHGGRERPARGPRHARQDDRVLDPEELGQWCGYGALGRHFFIIKVIVLPLGSTALFLLGLFVGGLAGVVNYLLTINQVFRYT